MDFLHLNIALFTLAICIQILSIYYAVRLYRRIKPFPISRAWLVFALSMALIVVRRSVYVVNLLFDCPVNGNITRLVEAVLLIIVSFMWFWFMRLKWEFYDQYIQEKR